MLLAVALVGLQFTCAVGQDRTFHGNPVNSYAFPWPGIARHRDKPRRMPWIRKDQNPITWN